MNTIHIISCSFNDLGFRPLNWEQFRKLNKGKATINENSFEFLTIDGEKMSGTLSSPEVVDKRDWYAKEYIASFNETGLKCFFSICWQKLNGGLSTNSYLHMNCLVNDNHWYLDATIEKQK